MMNRRQFLKTTGLGVASGLASNIASFNAFGADTSDYRALVCVFLTGGMDTHDLVIPINRGQSALYEKIRAPLLGRYDTSRRLNDGNLLPLEGGNAISGRVADGRPFALPPEMSSLHDLYQQQNMAIVANIGPSVDLINRNAWLNGSSATPPRLFSHSDQQSIWMADNPQGVGGTGWGGRMGDIMQAASANSFNSFTSVAVNRGSVFLNGHDVNSFTLSSNGGLLVDDLQSNSFLGSDSYTDTLRENIYNLRKLGTNYFQRDLQNITSATVDNNILVSDTLRSAPNTTASFPRSGLGRSLEIVAKMIGQREALGMRRQIFFVAEGGYDTHSNQTDVLPGKQKGINDVMAAFYNETVALGIQDNVCTFTASDFGRSLVPNTSGTDHGWGSHHFVMGGSVNGGRIFGDIPEPVLGHDQDAGQGRLIPQFAVDQYAFSMARWFGLTASEARMILPNASNLNEGALNGLFFNG